MPIPIQAPVSKCTGALISHAKPVVFASSSWCSGSFSSVTLGPQMQLRLQLQQQPHIPQGPQPHWAFSHARGASFGKPLDTGVPEFKPNTFSFTPPPNMPTSPYHSLSQPFAPFPCHRRQLMWTQIRCVHNRVTRSISAAARWALLIPRRPVKRAGR